MVDPEALVAAPRGLRLCLAVAGCLTTATRSLEVDQGRATMLAGRDPDATRWLSDAIEVSGDPEEWCTDGSHEWRRA